MRRRCRRICLTSGLALLASFAFASAAQATTFPGTNGRITASGSLAPAGSTSRLELFTMVSLYSDPNTTRPDECILTNNTNSDYNPRYSQDGKMIAWVQDNNVWTMKLDAQGKCQATDSQTPPQPIPPTKVTTQVQDTFVGGFSRWEAPDGTPVGPNDANWANRKAWIVFQRSPDLVHSFEVYKVQVDANGAAVAGTETNVSNTPVFSDSQPSFCSDGSKIAFHSNRDGDSDIHVMNANGGGVTNVTGDVTSGTNGSLAEESAPAFSGDCTKIAFQTNRDANPRPGEPRNLEIYRMNADGSDVKRLSYNDYDPTATGSGTNVTGFDLNPQWSPDGARICFHSGRNPDYRNSNGNSIIGQWDLYTLDAVNGELSPPAGQETERLTNRERNDERCGWQEKP